MQSAVCYQSASCAPARLVNPKLADAPGAGAQLCIALQQSADLYFGQELHVTSKCAAPRARVALALPMTCGLLGIGMHVHVSCDPRPARRASCASVNSGSGARWQARARWVPFARGHGGPVAGEAAWGPQLGSLSHDDGPQVIFFGGPTPAFFSGDGIV